MAKHESGKSENIKGRVKQAAGAVTGDKKMEAEGAAERTKGAAKEKIEQAEQTEKRAQSSDRDEELDEEKDV